jgi:STE24 endopeptidase
VTSNSRRLLGLLFLGVLAGGWIYATYELWQTTVPGNLKLPHVNDAQVFGAGSLHNAEHLTLVSNLFSLCGLLLPLIVLALYAKWGYRFMSESAAGPIGTGMMLGMIGLALVWISTIIPGLIELWWERKHGIADIGYVAWVIDGWFSLVPVFELICLTMLIVMGFAKLLGDRWWLAAAPAFVGAFALIVFITPYEMPLRSVQGHEQLMQSENRIAAEEGVDKIPLRVLDMGTQTDAPNAMSVGLGPSRRVVFWDTILDDNFSEPQLEVVLAHELAHHKHHHIFKQIAWFGLLILPLGYVIALITKRRGGMRTPLAVPLFLFLWVALVETAVVPVNNAFSRRMEAEADWTALQATRDPQADKALFERFFRETRQDPDPSFWQQSLFGSHPSFEQRIAMAEAWSQRNGG